MFFILLSLFFSGVNSIQLDVNHLDVNENLSSVYVLEDPIVNWSYLIECYEDKYGISPMEDERVEHAQNTGEIWMYNAALEYNNSCLLYTSPSPRDLSTSRMPSSA